MQKITNIIEIRKLHYIEFKKSNFFAPLIFLALSILFLLIFTTFFPLNIGGSIGIGAEVLSIGDRNFYLNRNDGV